MHQAPALRSSTALRLPLRHHHRANIRSSPARAARVRAGVGPATLRSRLASRPRSCGHSPSRSTSTRPSAITSARKDGSALGVLEPDDIDAPTSDTVSLAAARRPDPGLDREDNEHINVACRRVGTSRRRSEQQREVDVVLGAQRCPQRRQQLPRPPRVLPLGQRYLQRPRGWPDGAKLPCATARRSVRSCTPNSSANNASSVMCPL